MIHVLKEEPWLYKNMKHEIKRHSSSSNNDLSTFDHARKILFKQDMHTNYANQRNSERKTNLSPIGWMLEMVTSVSLGSSFSRAQEEEKEEPESASHREPKLSPTVNGLSLYLPWYNVGVHTYYMHIHAGYDHFTQSWRKWSHLYMTNC